MDNVTALLIGITSSLVATAIFVTIAEIIRRWFWPLLADQIYKGVRLDGKWQACRLGDKEIDPKGWPRMEFIIKQKSDCLTGTASIFESEEKTPDSYKINGHIRDGYVSLILDPISSEMIDASACVFRVFHGKDKLRLKGRQVYLDNSTAQIVATEKELEYCKIGS